MTIAERLKDMGVASLAGAVILMLLLGFANTGHCDESAALYTGGEFIVTDSNIGEEALSAIAVYRATAGPVLLGGRVYLGELEAKDQLDTFQSLEFSASLSVPVAKWGTMDVSPDILYGYIADVSNGGGFDAYGVGVRVGTEAFWFRVYAAVDQSVDNSVHPGVSALLPLKGPFFFSFDRLFAERGRNRVGVYFRFAR